MLIAEKDDLGIKKDIKYWLYLFFLFVIFTVIGRAIGLGLSWIVFMIYLFGSAYLAYKAYSWDTVELDFIDQLDEKVKEKTK